MPYIPFHTSVEPSTDQIPGIIVRIPGGFLVDLLRLGTPVFPGEVFTQVCTVHGYYLPRRVVPH